MRNHENTPKYEPQSIGQSLLTSGTTPRPKNIDLINLSIPQFFAPATVTPQKNYNLTTLQPISKFTTPIKESDWTAFRNNLFSPNVSITPAHKEKSNYDSNSSESDYDADEVNDPLFSLYHKVDYSSIQTKVKDNSKQNYDTLGIKTTSLLMPSQKCYKRVSSFLDQNNLPISNTSLIPPFKTAQEEKAREEKAKAALTTVSKTNLNCERIIASRKKQKMTQGSLRRKTIVKIEPLIPVKEPTTPIRRRTFVIPMAPRKTFIESNCEDESSIEGEYEVSNK